MWQTMLAEATDLRVRDVARTQGSYDFRKFVGEDGTLFERFIEPIQELSVRPLRLVLRLLLHLVLQLVLRLLQLVLRLLQQLVSPQLLKLAVLLERNLRSGLVETDARNQASWLSSVIAAGR